MRFRTASMLLIWLFVIALPGTALSDSVETKYGQVKKAYLEFLKQSPKQKARRDLWMRHINSFLSIQKKSPRHARADDCLYWVGNAYQEMYTVSLIKKDLHTAIATYERLIERYPKSNLADDAAFFIAELYEQPLNSPQQAYQAYVRCSALPNGDMATKAIACKTRLARYAPTPTPTPVPEPTPVPTPREDSGLPAEIFQTACLEKVDVWSNPTYTRIVIYLNRNVPYSEHLLPPDPDHHMPRRLFLDFNGSVLGQDLPTKIPVGDGLLKQVRVGQFQENVVRVVLDIQSIQSHRIFPMVEPYRVVIDVMGTPAAAPTPKVAQIRRIVLDPGHGGKDPGAVGYGSQEKRLALIIAKKAAANLRAMGFDVVMTRDTDYFIPLEGRTAMANKLNADLFISVHINAARRRSASGIDTYHFSPRARKEDMELVATENKTAAAQVEQMNIILAGLELGYKKMESNALATEVQNRIIKQIDPHYKGTVNRGVKSAPFYVLMGANMPAILVECGFITNRSDHKRLNFGRYQTRLATGIAEGVADYVRSLDPTWKPETAELGGVDTAFGG